MVIQIPSLQLVCKIDQPVEIPPGKYDFTYIKNNTQIISNFTASHHTILHLAIPDQFLIIDDQYHEDITSIAQDGDRSFKNIMSWTDLHSRLNNELKNISQMMNVWPGARNVQEAKDILAVSCPNAISFDHDLGIVGSKEQTSMDIVHFMIERDLDKQGQYIPEDFVFAVHSQNPVGKENIVSTLNRYLSFRKNP